MFHVKHTYYKILYNLALKSYLNGDIPVGAIIIDNNGNIIGKGFNTRQFKFDVCGHAEINAIKKAEFKIKDWRLNNYSLITTLQPCELCLKAIEASRIDKVYYFLDQPNLKYKNTNIIKINDNNEYIQKYMELLKKAFIDTTVFLEEIEPDSD